MNLGFKVKLDTDHEAGVLELAVVVNGTLEEVSCGMSDMAPNIDELRLTDGSVGGARQARHGEGLSRVLLVGVSGVEGVVGVAGAERVAGSGSVAGVAGVVRRGVGRGGQVGGGSGGAGRGVGVLGTGGKNQLDMKAKLGCDDTYGEDILAVFGREREEDREWFEAESRLS